MENLLIPPNKDTPYFPEVIFNATTGVLEIIGESYMEDTYKFYLPLINWIEDFKNKRGGILTLNIKLSYINTATSKCLLEIFEILKKYNDQNKDVIINWYYNPEDIDMLSDIEDFQIESGLDINIYHL